MCSYFMSSVWYYDPYCFFTCPYSTFDWLSLTVTLTITLTLTLAFLSKPNPNLHHNVSFKVIVQIWGTFCTWTDVTTHADCLQLKRIITSHIFIMFMTLFQYYYLQYTHALATVSKWLYKHNLNLIFSTNDQKLCRWEI